MFVRRGIYLLTPKVIFRRASGQSLHRYYIIRNGQGKEDTGEEGKRRLIEQYCEIAYYLYKPQTSKLFCMGNVANGYICVHTERFKVAKVRVQRI